MLDPAKFLRPLKILGPVIILIWSLAHLTNSRAPYRALLRQFRDEKKLFVDDFLEHEVDGRFNGAPIADLCSSKKWTRGLILSCEPPGGGIGKVKNGHLHCIRIAMEMGAELIFPDILKRSDHDITKFPSGRGPRRGVTLDYFFDREHLNRSLSTFCPQMRLHSSMNDFHDVPSLLTPLKLSVQDVMSGSMEGNMLAKPQLLGHKLLEWLDQESPPRQRRYPLRVHLRTPIFTFPTAFDPPDFVAHFGRILRIREDARLLAAASLFNMAKMFDLNLDPRNGIKKESFVGVHLRTERDGLGRFPVYEDQAADYLAYIAENKMAVAFLATGASGENVIAFAERTRDFNCTMVLKKDILEGEDLERLEELTWDQRALVDYEIMLRAGLITGIAESSFAWNLAMRRRNAYARSSSLDPPAPDGHVQWRDQYSIIYGKPDVGRNMRLTIWP